MSESGPSLSEIRLPKHTNNSTPGETPTTQPPAIRQSNPSTWTEKLKSIGLRLTGEEPYKPENFTTERIAGVISTSVRNPLLEKSGQNPYQNGFNIRDVLSNSGHVRSMGDPNSQAYQATRQALHALVRDGILEEQRSEEAFRGEFVRYHVVDPEGLQAAIHPPEEQKPNQ